MQTVKDAEQSQSLTTKLLDLLMYQKHERTPGRTALAMSLMYKTWGGKGEGGEDKEHATDMLILLYTVLIMRMPLSLSSQDIKRQ